MNAISSNMRIARATLLMIALGTLILLFAMIFPFLFMGYKVYYVGTPSMEPVLKVGEYIIVDENMDRVSVDLYDIVEVETNDGRNICHRMIGVTDDLSGSTVYTIQGDNNNGAVELVDESAVVGEVLGRVSTNLYNFYKTLCLTMVVVGVLSALGSIILTIKMPEFSS